ncbi:cell division protein FtsA [Luteithermobacter gelatinilyticus]|uniref:cell division protein FtsA n=1 Tax=Luteithermobacter gelatinilyticus TaxID=2582913 RepID=UPI001106B042|nr:cell division protein FtsA [Luteithermobacter gelatinilyticus]|tara:strand:- start:2340 stop:3593 length:1254 start_codon:yes stop_codon:yes gene_type:complete
MAGMRDNVIAALDIGSSKICCFIARINDQGRPQVIGIGHQVSQGLKAGTVVDMEETETSIRTAVDTAERMAGGSPIENVIVNISAGHPESSHFAVDVDVAGHQISEMDIERVLGAARDYIRNEDRYVVHSRPASYTIDGVGGVKNPRGMYGEKLGVDMHLATVAVSPLKNLQTCINRCHLNMAGVVLSAYASGLATMVEDERELGSVCIDMGGGLTTLAAFKDGEFIYADTVPLGGHHVTSDIAQGLSTPRASAERLKTLYGTCFPRQVVREQIDIVQTGDDGGEYTTTIPRAMLTSIIEARMEEIFELVRDRLVDSGLDPLVGRRLVLTGGASQMSGVEDLAKKVFGTEKFDRHVRLGRPLSVDGLADATAGPVFSTCAGLLTYAATRPEEVHYQKEKQPLIGILPRIGRWIKENF